MTVPFSELVAEAREALAGAAFEGPRREAVLLVARATGQNEAFVLAHPDAECSESDAHTVRDFIARRSAGEPMAYLFRSKEFWGRDFYVDPRVLVPRPETEHLVETALALDLPAEARVVDLCTGSGCIGITLSLERPRWEISCFDISLPALGIAQRNSRELGADVTLAAGDLLSAVDLGSTDLVVCNPPYVDDDERDSLSVEIREHEPALALFAGEKGLDVYRRVFATLGAFALPLRSVLEIGASQATDLAKLASRHSLSVERVVPDLAGRDRVLVLHKAM